MWLTVSWNRAGVLIAIACPSAAARDICSDNVLLNSKKS